MDAGVGGKRIFLRFGNLCLREAAKQERKTETQDRHTSGIHIISPFYI